MASINDFGSSNDPLQRPSLTAWAAAVAAVLNNSDSPVNTRLAAKLNLSGGTMTGPLILSGPPTAPLGAATKDYADTAASSAAGAQAAVVGNLLTANQASVETDTTGLAFTSGTPTIERTTAYARDGAASLKVTAATANSCGFALYGAAGSWAKVTPGQVYTAAVYARPDTTDRSFAVSIIWYTAASASISQTVGAVTRMAPDAWTRGEYVGVAPANAAYARLAVNVYNAPVGEAFYFDSMGIWAGAGGQWALPGVPIIGIGKRTNADGDIELWDSATSTWVGPYSQKSTIGNMLIANVASGTDTLSDTTGLGGTAASRADQAYSGTRSIKVENTSGAAGQRYVTAGQGSTGNGISSGSIPVTPGQPYTVSARVYGYAGINMQVRIYWWTSAGNVAASTARVDFTYPGAVPWQHLTGTAIAPANAAYASVAVFTQGADLPAGGSFYVDEFGFWAGAGGEWAMPGVPILGLGRRVTHPNVDDVLAEQWDSGKGRWQRVHYDSGWRNLPNLYPGANDQTCQIRRVNDAVTLLISVNAQSCPASNADLVLIPDGFRPKYAYLQDGGWYAVVNQYVSGAYMASNYFRLNKGTVASVDFRGQHHWETYQSIPTSLPGTLVSAAPN